MPRSNWATGKSMNFLLDLDPETWMDLDAKELKSVVSRLASAANKRVKRADASGSASWATKAVQRGGKFSVAGKDLASLRNEYQRVRNFLQDPTSTTAGWKEAQRDLGDILRENGYDVTQAQVGQMINAYNHLMEVDGTVLTRDERYKYMKELAEITGGSSWHDAEAILNDMQDAINELGLSVVSEVEDDQMETGISRFFEF